MVVECVICEWPIEASERGIIDMEGDWIWSKKEPEDQDSKGDNDDKGAEDLKDEAENAAETAVEEAAAARISAVIVAWTVEGPGRGGLWPGFHWK